MNRETQSVVMLLVGGVVLRISTTDMYLRYVKAGLKPYLIASALVLIVVGIATLARDLRVRYGASAGKHRAAALDHAVCHDPGHAGPAAAWLLVVPVLALILIAPPSLGGFAASRAGTATALAKDRIEQSAGAGTGSAESSMYPALAAGDPVTLPMLDYAARAVFDEGRSLKGRTIKLTGFVTPGPNGKVYIARMIVVCCAADARPIKVGLSGKLGAAGRAKSDQWIQVVGRFDPKQDHDQLNDEKIPYLKVSSVRKIAQPANAYDS